MIPSLSVSAAAGRSCSPLALGAGVVAPDHRSVPLTARSVSMRKLVPSRFHNTRPSGSTPRAINSRLRTLLVAVLSRA
jgi:hypothetical protein